MSAPDSLRRRLLDDAYFAVYRLTGDKDVARDVRRHLTKRWDPATFGVEVDAYKRHSEQAGSLLLSEVGRLRRERNALLDELSMATGESLTTLRRLHLPEEEAA